MQTEIRGGSAVTWLTVLAMRPVAFSPSQEETI